MKRYMVSVLQEFWYECVWVYEGVDVKDENEARFFCMCGPVHTISNEGAGDTHSLNYT